MTGTEYITEWPPPSTASEKLSAERKEEEANEAAPKRQKLCEEKEKETGSNPFSITGGTSCSTSSFIQSPPSQRARTLLARWWKEKSKIEESPLISGTQSVNPNTILFHCSRLDTARNFLKLRIDHLKSLSWNPSELYDVNFSLATCYHMLGSDIQCTNEALRHAEEAKKADGDDSKEVDWLIELLKRQKAVEEEKIKGMKKIEKWTLSSLKMPPCTQVERRPFSSLSGEEFYKKYAKTRTPVIITGIVEQITDTKWTLDYIKEVIGHKKAPLKKVVLSSMEWAKLEDAGECRVNEFIDSLEHQSKEYLFDWSLPLNCPELMKGLRIPEYFTDNILQRTPESTLYRDSWPSLFIAPAGITSELHVDAFGSNFWMALFEGRKRWLFFPSYDLPYLYPIYNNSTDATFEVNLSDVPGEVSRYPLLALTHPRECTLSTGELLFVPSGWPHRVYNLEKSLAISANFVDGSNFNMVKEELRVNSLQDPRAQDLLTILEEGEFGSVLEI